jgi:hypothetical protein
VRVPAQALGVELIVVGIGDVMPRQINDLMNRATEPKKAAEANFIARLKKTVAICRPANTAKPFASSLRS